MEIRFSEKMEDFQPGIFAVLNEKKEELYRQGRKVYNLSVGTPDFKPAPHIMEAMAKACEDPANYGYSLTELPELIEAVRYRYRHRFGVKLDADEIMSVYGSQEGMSHIGMIFCDPGDTILIRIRDIRCLKCAGSWRKPISSATGWIRKTDTFRILTGSRKKSWKKQSS